MSEAADLANGAVIAGRVTLAVLACFSFVMAVVS